MSRNYAVISIGSNSTRMLVADIARVPARIVMGRSIGTRIGEGVDETGVLGEEPMRRTIEAATSHYCAIRGHYVKLFVIATSAVRRASNGEEFTHRLHGALGTPVHVLSGDEEAAASFRGAVSVLGPRRRGTVGVADVGGGSTEYALGSEMDAAQTQSFEIGAVRLTETFPQLSGARGAVDATTIERAREAATMILRPLAGFPAVTQLVLVGGSASTLAAVVRGTRTAGITPSRLSRADVAHTLVRLSNLPLDARKTIVGMKPQRADIFPAGLLVIETLLDLLGHDSAVATTADLLLGYLIGSA